MMTLRFVEEGLDGISHAELEKAFPQYDRVRRMERYGIRKFMEANRQYFQGMTMDFGCGKHPYRDLVSGRYIGIEKNDAYQSDWVESFDCIICNQVLQFIIDPVELFGQFIQWLRPGGVLVMTGGTNWPEVEHDDFMRLTRAGVRHFLEQVGFVVELCESRSEIAVYNHVRFSMGWNVIARKI